jgi:hypothetical protein
MFTTGSKLLIGASVLSAVAALVYGLTNAMFLNTTRPFTEGLAYFLLLLALGRAEALLRDPRAWRGLELGVWLGLIILTRSQLVLAAMAVAGTLAWAVARLGWRRGGLVLGEGGNSGARQQQGSKEDAGHGELRLSCPAPIARPCDVKVKARTFVPAPLSPPPCCLSPPGTSTPRACA